MGDALQSRRHIRLRRDRRAPTSGLIVAKRFVPHYSSDVGRARRGRHARAARALGKNMLPRLASMMRDGGCLADAALLPALPGVLSLMAILPATTATTERIGPGAEPALMCASCRARYFERRLLKRNISACCQSLPMSDANCYKDRGLSMHDDALAATTTYGWPLAVFRWRTARRRRKYRDDFSPSGAPESDGSIPLSRAYCRVLPVTGSAIAPMIRCKRQPSFSAGYAMLFR